ncbi:MAG: hypothetical protein JXQ30_16805 [Spirochaetes bacterium]|nr:hypothetical protein [Spirochaetota bacterium]
MKRTVLILSIIGLLIAGAVLFGCADAAVKTAISNFTSAVNADSVDQVKNALSPESNFYITQEFGTFLDYFDGNRPVAYSNYTINVSGADADAYASATYSGVPVSGGVWFWFKRDNTFLSFLFPSYKVYRYYDNGDWTDPIWKKIQDRLAEKGE